jgi:hypothetical protein
MIHADQDWGIGKIIGRLAGFEGQEGGEVGS